MALTGAPEPIYAQDPNDAWNRIFYFLFSRRIQAHLSDEFPEGAPFSREPIGPGGVFVPALHVSKGLFERKEVGDRAIDPLYPSFLVAAGSRLVLTDPVYSKFIQALQEALNEKVTRSVIARALMQSDLWAAHDILFVPFLPSDERELAQHRQVAVDLLSRLLKKIALTPEEIKSLPDNYAVAAQRYSLPDGFHKDSGWMEVMWFPGRMHDYSADYRRVARVFVKPTHPPRDVQKFLNAPGLREHPEADLDGVALVIQLLLIDSEGRLRPTTLTTDVQVRLFEKTNEGAFKKTTLQVCEISRRLLVQEPGSAGLVPEQESDPTYLPGVGSMFGLAEGQAEGPPGLERLSVVGPPVVVKLRTRCTTCHGTNLTQVNTFSIVLPPRPPLVRQLNPAASEAADFDVSQKKKRQDFMALRGSFDRPWWSWW
ncbi:MAG: hypothetical protein ACLQOO_20225 [Terriglobia bacterium]